MCPGPAQVWWLHILNQLISCRIDTFNPFTYPQSATSFLAEAPWNQNTVWISWALVIPKHIFISIPWELHLLILPMSHCSLKLCSVIHPSLSKPAEKPTDTLSGLSQSPREQRHNKLRWIWADNVFCLWTAQCFTMKCCQCVGDCTISTSLSLSFCLSMMWGNCEAVIGAEPGSSAGGWVEVGHVRGQPHCGYT